MCDEICCKPHVMIGIKIYNLECPIVKIKNTVTRWEQN